MSVPYVSLLNVISHILGSDHSVDYIQSKNASYKLHQAHLMCIDACITMYDLTLIDDIKAMFINGNTTVSGIAIVELIKAKWAASKDVSTNKYLERAILLDLLNHLKQVKTIGRNQLLIELSKCILKHTNGNAYDLIMYWK